MATSPDSDPPEPETFVYFIETEVSNLSGFSSIAGDEYSSISGDELFDYLKSSASSDNFSIDLSFKMRKTGSVSGISYLPIPIVSYPPELNGIVISKLNSSTVRISGTTSRMFNDEYQFVLDDGSKVSLPPDTTHPFKALVQYSMPSPTQITIQYPFVLDVSPSDLPSTKAITQYSYWIIGGTFNNIKSLVKRGI
jgi:hypothetical protein